MIWRESFKLYQVSVLVGDVFALVYGMISVQQTPLHITEDVRGIDLSGRRGYLHPMDHVGNDAWYDSPSTHDSLCQDSG